MCSKLNSSSQGQAPLPTRKVSTLSKNFPRRVQELLRGGGGDLGGRPPQTQFLRRHAARCRASVRSSSFAFVFKFQRHLGIILRFRTQDALYG